MVTAEPMSLTLAEAACKIKSREISPVELTQESLDRIDELQPKLNAFITICPDQALSAARKAERDIAGGKYRGPLHGIPYAVKDIYASKGIRSTSGSRVFADHFPDHDSTAVRKLNSAGAIMVGKNNTNEFASGGDDSSFYGPVQNPWKLGYTPGGSSSGSAASVAAGMIFASMGSCTGGSVRVPGSNCSLVGLKPSYGLVSRYGIFPLSWSLDHPGLLTRTVEDCALLLQTVAGYDSKDPSSTRVSIPDYASALTNDIRGIRVGVPRELREGTSAEVDLLVEKALSVLRELGASVEEVSVPITDDYATTAGNVITWSEAGQIHTPYLQHLHEYSIGVREKVQVGLVIPSNDYHKAQKMRRKVQEELTQMLNQVDVLVGPIQRTPPGTLQLSVATGAATGMATQRSFTRPFNLTGMPAVSVPCGFSPEGLPVGLQIAGRLFDDSTVLRVAHAYEQATPWHDMHPSIS